MTLLEGLNILKSQGVTKLVGMIGITAIDTYIEHAAENHQNALKWGNPKHDDYYSSWKYALDHENDSFMVNLPDNHHIIATHYDGFDMATYSDYETEEEMTMVFDNWKIAKNAMEIAKKKVEQGSELSFNTWKVIAIMELVAAQKTAHDAFERKFKNA